MKTSIIILAVLLAVSVGASHKKQKSVKSTEAGDSEWPQPVVIQNFEPPPEFTANPNVPIDDDVTSTTPNDRHHGKSKHKAN